MNKNTYEVKNDENKEFEEIQDPSLITKIEITTTSKTKSRTWCEIRLNSSHIVSRTQISTLYDDNKDQLKRNHMPKPTKIEHKLLIPNQLVITIDPFRQNDKLSLTNNRKETTRLRDKFANFRRTLKNTFNFRKNSFLNYWGNLILLYIMYKIKLDPK